MTPCESLHVEISAYLDGECDPLEAERIRDHLTGCADCRHTLQSWRAIGERLRREDLTPGEFPAMRTAISRALAKELDAGLSTSNPSISLRSFLRSRRGLYALASAAAITVAIGGSFYFAATPVDNSAALAEIEGANRVDVLAQRHAVEALRLEIGSLRLLARATIVDERKLDGLDRESSTLLASADRLATRVSTIQSELDRTGLWVLDVVHAEVPHVR